jgi:prepilin-type N-terminal cleavage/methylation domain-containing protein/prepilin-type processing-associated H-X9-DG protein
MPMKPRRGFTLIELLMVVLIVGLLVSLLLPAVVEVRESARRAQCANNLMQLGIAIGSYASTHSVLPPGVVNGTGPIENLPRGYHHSWIMQILPYCGQQNIYNHCDLNASAYHVANDTAARMRIATLMCPSENRRAAGVISYAGSHDDLDRAISAENHGVLYLNSRVRYDEINDGPAYTILLGEIREAGLSLGWMSGTRSTLRNTSYPPGDSDPLERARATIDQMLANINDISRKEIYDMVELLAERGIWPVSRTGGFSSTHTGYCNFLFCDGSVRAVKKTIDMRIFRLLGNREDGEPISADAY